MTTATDLRCPGALHAVPARDGLLARIRIPGGLLAPAQLATLGRLARRCGSGIVEITARANVQLRGLDAERTDELADGLTEAGLLVSATHDRVRNIVASPLAWIDPDERLDVRPFVRSLHCGSGRGRRARGAPGELGYRPALLRQPSRSRLFRSRAHGRRGGLGARC